LVTYVLGLVHAGGVDGGRRRRRGGERRVVELGREHARVERVRRGVAGGEGHDDGFVGVDGLGCPFRAV